MLKEIGSRFIQFIKALSREKLLIVSNVTAAYKLRYSHILHSKIKVMMEWKKKAACCNLRFFKHGYDSKALYFGLSMLTLSMVLLTGVLIGMGRNNWNTVLGGEQQRTEQNVSANQRAVKAIEIVPQSAAAILPQEVPKEKNLHTPTTFYAIKGPVKLDFGWQLHPIYKEWRYHGGIDIEGVKDQAVQAVCSGEVSEIVQDKIMGLTVVVKSNEYKIYYGSLSETAISKGSHVDAGQKIGKMGVSPGEPYYHVHLAIKKGEHAINPRAVCTN